MFLTAKTLGKFLDEFSAIVDCQYVRPEHWPDHIGLLLPPDHPEHRAVRREIEELNDPELCAVRQGFLDDYSRLERGQSPDPSHLISATTIMPTGVWHSHGTMTIGLIGLANKPDDALTVRRTSMIAAWDRPHLKWVRTLNRSYNVNGSSVH